MSAPSAQLAGISLNDAPPVPFAKRQPPGKEGVPMKVRTNARPLILPPNVPIYKYDFRAYAVFKNKDGEEKFKELTKQTRDDYPEMERKNRCVMLYKKLFVNDAKFFGKMEDYAYDRAAIIFSAKKLAINGEKTIIMKNGQIPENFGLTDVDRIEIKIKAVTDSYQLSTNDIPKVVGTHSADTDKGIMEYVNLLTSQDAFFTPGRFITYGTTKPYLYEPDKFGFRNVPALTDDKYIGIGADKSVKVVDGGANPRAIVNVNVKKSAFHGDGMPFVDKLCVLTSSTPQTLLASLERNKKVVERQMKGIYLETNYGPKKVSFQFGGFGDAPGRVKLENGKTLVQYFAEKYKIKLNCPALPTVVRRMGPKVSLYPPELLIIGANQRVSLHQQTPDLTSKLIKAAASLPAVREDESNKMAQAMNLTKTSKSPYLEAIKASVGDPILLEARSLKSPVIAARGQSQVKNNSKFDIAGGLERSGTIKKWAMYAQLTGRDAHNRSGILRELTSKAWNVKVNDLKIALPPPAIMEVIHEPNEGKLRDVIKKGAENGFDLIFFVTSDNITLHGKMKALEAEFQVATQEMKMSSAMNVVDKNRHLTLSNLLLKTNLKTGGTNYRALYSGASAEAWIAGPDGARLIIGIDMSHPPPLTAVEKARGVKPRQPSVIGFAANTTSDIQSFVGDFRLAEARNTEIAAHLKEIVITCLDQMKAKRGVVPKHVVIFRGGISEGQYDMVRKEEYPQIIEAFHSKSPKYNPSVTLIVVTKDHNNRFYTERGGGANATEQNVSPGMVVDKGLTNPALSEFFLQSHLAFQGTAKVPKYTVIVDDVGAPLDRIEQLTHGLCFLHGIVTSTTSIPTPLYVAKEYSKRGLNNFIATFGDDSSVGEGGVDMERANERISNKNKSLALRRVNA